MPTKYKILIYIGGLVFVIVVLAVIVNSLQNKPSQNGQGSGPAPTAAPSLPDYLLENEAQVRTFTENFLSLYNTYAYSDYSNLTALGDYETPEIQQDTVDKVAALSQSTPVGFSIRTVADDSSFNYTYQEVSKLTVNLSAKVTETNSNTDANSTYNVSAQLTLTPAGQNWLVSGISMIKK